MDRETYNQFRNAVAASKIDPALEMKPVVAVLYGPCSAIECIVQEASKESGIPMDWGYSGGRAFIRADGDKDKARKALRWKMPGGLIEGEEV